MVRKWLLPTLSEILGQAEPHGIDLQVPEVVVDDGVDGETIADDRSQLQWESAIASVQILLERMAATHEDRSPLGILLTSHPAPGRVDTLAAWGCSVYTFTSSHSHLQLPPGDPCLTPQPSDLDDRTIALLPTDPLDRERFYLLLTHHFGLVITLGDDRGCYRTQFSFEPRDLALAWQSLRGRILLTHPDLLPQIDRTVEQFEPIDPDYRWVMAFSQYLLHAAATPITTTATPTPQKRAVDVELLHALTHEIRTPLTTIRTMTRSLLRQPDLSTRATQRLESIDRECTEQIDRMELIFSAVELASAQVQDVALTKMSLQQLLEQSVPLWQQQAQRRNLDLCVELPQKLPAVVSNPTMLNRILTGLVDNFTRNLPAGSKIQVEVTPAGDRLKLQLQSQLDRESEEPIPEHYSIGQLLTFQPETGNLSLNMNVTKNLFQLLGGKLIVRQNLDRAQTFTIFLPLSL